MANQDDPNLKQFIQKSRIEFERKTFFINAFMDPSIHWFFSQGQEALENQLYIPGVSSLLNGVEASLRVTMAQLDGSYDEKLSPYKNLSNPLLRQAKEAGLPVELLALKGETDFLCQIQTKTCVSIVQLRHDICHGNILNFIEKSVGILTPECLRPTAAHLLGVSYKWALGLAAFRARAGIRPCGFPIPHIPKNPLEEWL